MEGARESFVFVSVVSTFEECCLHGDLSRRSGHRDAERGIASLVLFRKELSNRCVKFDVSHIMTGRLHCKAAGKFVLMEVAKDLVHDD